VNAKGDPKKPFGIWLFNTPAVLTFFCSSKALLIYKTDVSPLPWKQSLGEDQQT
jgi:hypothetical protein